MTTATHAHGSVRFHLPPERIALRPARRAMRRGCWSCGPARPFDDRGVRDLPDLLRPGDALVVNDTGDPGAADRPAHRPRHRAADRGDPAPSGSTARAGAPSCGRRSGSRRRRRALRRGGQGLLPRPARRHGRGKGEGGEVTLPSRSTGRCSTRRSTSAATCRCRPISRRGARPTTQDRADYQTMFAHDEGSVAAPTAGLHFTDELLARLAGARHRPAQGDAACRRRARSCRSRPTTRRSTGCMPKRRASARRRREALNAARRAGGRIVAVGSTVAAAARERRGRDGIDPAVRRRDRRCSSRPAIASARST